MFYELGQKAGIAETMKADLKSVLLCMDLHAQMTQIESCPRKRTRLLTFHVPNIFNYQNKIYQTWRLFVRFLW